jgi:hypothetical protein
MSLLWLILCLVAMDAVRVVFLDCVCVCTPFWLDTQVQTSMYSHNLVRTPFADIYNFVEYHLYQPHSCSHAWQHPGPDLVVYMSVRHLSVVCFHIMPASEHESTCIIYMLGFNLSCKDTLSGTSTTHNNVVLHPFDKKMRRNAVFMHGKHRTSCTSTYYV